MAREWVSTCKDCGKEYGYSHASHLESAKRGMSRPERCPECRKLHSREISTLGLSHFDLTPITPIPPTGLKPGRLGGLVRPERVHRSVEQVSKVDFAAKFGIQDEHILKYFALMQKHQVTVVVAPTGAGKSTFLPYRLMVPPNPLPPDLWTRHGQIIITQPRIQATRGIPAYVSRDLNGSSLGAGFDIGFRHSGSPATDWRNKMVYMTDGSLINMIVRNELGRLGVIMIDEAHERSINIDLILGLLKAQLPRYPHLRLIIASATIDTELFGHYFGVPDEAIFEFPGKRKFPVEARFWYDKPIPFEQFSGRMPDAVAQKAFDILLAMETGSDNDLITMTIDDAPKGPVKGDILAFLHGEKPIEDAVSALKGLIDEEPRLSGKVDVLPLYTRLPQHRQDAALQPKKDKRRWRVVISTNVAETSLTVEGIVHVIETGLINESQWDPKTQTSFVVPKQHSQAGCKQRWGRAGRVQPGIAHCLYTEEQFNQFPEHTDPEIVRAPIDQIVLTAKAAGVDDIVDFDWIQRPSESELARAPHYLRQLGALDKDGDLTEHGLELRNFAAEIDVANLMILADRFACVVEMATLLPMINIGGYRALLQWDRGWDAPTKRAVHRIHQGLMAPCQDDVEFYLKLWAAWEEADNQPAYQSRSRKGKEYNPRSVWASHHFVNHNLLVKANRERESLLGSLSGHKKEESARPIDFSLLTRLRIVLTYGLPTQIYQLLNKIALQQDPTLDPEYQPYLADPDASPEVKALHKDATIAIGPESICFNSALELFVCGKRQRIRFRTSPQKEPETRIIATFLSLIKPEWLSVIGKPPIAVARMIAQETRDSKGDLRLTTTDARVFLDQAYPIGSQFRCMATGSNNSVRLEQKVRPAPRLRVGKSYEEADSSGIVEVLNNETELDAFAGIDKETKRKVVVINEEDDLNLWTEIIDEGEEEPYHDIPSLEAIRERELFEGVIVNLTDHTVMPEGDFVATVVSYDFTDRAQPKINLEIPAEPDPFDAFAQRFHAGTDIEVEIVRVEDFINDFALYLIVREPETQLEIVLDQYDASLIARNFAIQMLADKLGGRLVVTVDEIDKQSRHVRASRLKTSEEALVRFMGRDQKRVVDALVADVRENGLYLWLDYLNTTEHAPVGAFVRLDRLIQRPDEMQLNEICRVEVAPKNWKRPLRRSLANIDPSLSADLSKRLVGGPLQWDEVTQTLSLNSRMPYVQRQELLRMSDDEQFRSAANWLFRRSNELHVRILDVTGVESLAPLIGQTTTATVVHVTDDFVDLEVQGGLQIGVPKHKAIYERDRSLPESFEKDKPVEIWVEEVDLENVHAEVSLLDPALDPLNNFHPGQFVQGRVLNIEPFGAFVELAPGAEGMVHVSELAWYRVEKPSDVVTPGQLIEVQILDIKRSDRRAELTSRLTKNDPLRNYKVDQRVGGKVSGFTPDGSGAFIELEPGAEGFLYRDEIRLERDNDAREILGIGQPVTVRITELNYDDRKMRLTIRGLYERVVFVPNSHAHMVIGRGGKEINGIMQETQTYIDLADDGECTVQGLQQRSVDAAVRRIEAIVARRIVTFNLDDRQKRMLIGKGGSTIREIQSHTGARIDSERDSPQVTVTAENDTMLRDVLAKIQTAVTYVESTILIPSTRIGYVVGTGGSTIKNIKSQTATWIDIAKDNSGRIRIEGSSSYSVERAIAMIRTAAGSATVIESKQGGLPSYKEIRSTAPPQFRSKTTRSASPIDFQPPAPPPKPASPSVKSKTQTSQPSHHAETLQLTTSQIDKLELRSGGLLTKIFGGGKSALDRIRQETGAQIRVDHKSQLVSISGKSSSTIKQAMNAIRLAIEE